MKIYLDSSWWISLKIKGDRNHEKAVKILEKFQPKADFLWTVLHQMEVYNSLRQLEYQKVIASREAQRLIEALEDEILEGFWLRQDFEWGKVIEIYEKNSFLHGVKHRVRAMDLMHISAAISMCAEGFVSYDEDQVKAAKRIGLEILT